MNPPVLDATGDPPPAPGLARATDALIAGLVVAVPTDTVYGLAVDPVRPGASDRVFAAKRRSRDVTLPLLVADVSQAEAVAEVSTEARELMARYWPGPLTIVLSRRPGLGLDLGDEEHTVGVRCPGHPVPRALCAAVGPLAVTSANRHGEPTPSDARAVASVFGPEIALVLDAGPGGGAPSAVVDCTGIEPAVLRAGPVPGFGGAQPV